MRYSNSNEDDSHYSEDNKAGFAQGKPPDKTLLLISINTHTLEHL